MIAVVITKYERQRIELIAKARNSAKKPEWSRKKLNSFSDEQMDLLGIRGEFAAAQYLGTFIDTNVHPHGDNGIDLYFHNKSVSVKYNHRWLGYLIVEARPNDIPQNGTIHDLQTDIIILTHGKCKPPTRCLCNEPGGLVVVVSGWLYKHEFLNKMHTTDWGIGPKYFCKTSDLHPIHSIWEI